MDPNARLLEQLQIVPAFTPGSMGSGAHTGDTVCLKNYRRCIVLFHKGIGPSADDPTITMHQATDVAAGTNKALTFTTIYVKSDLTHLSDVGQWTKVTQAAASTYTDSTAGESEILWAIEFKAEDLDIANDYNCLYATVADTGTSTLSIGCIYYILGDPLLSTAPQDMPSAIID